VAAAARRRLAGWALMAEPVLVDQFGRPLQRPKPTKDVLTREIAGPTLAGVRTPQAGYPADGLNPYRLAAILREADAGEPLRYLELAEIIEERDLHYAGVLATRKRSVAQIDISVEAAGDDQRSVDQADAVRDWLSRDELQDELFDVLDAIGKGLSYTEIIWDSSEGQWRPARLEWRDPRWFTVARHDLATPLLIVEGGGGEPLPWAKFITARIKAKSGLPIRSGLARLDSWAWMFKAFTQRDWAIFCQTYGQPIRVGKYGPGATEADKETLFRAVANIGGDMAAIIPESMLIEFVQSSNVGASADLYESRSDWLDRQVSKAVLGQTATTDAIAGGHAVGREHRQVQEDIERADAKALSAILNRDLLRPWIDLEYGPQPSYPRLQIARPEKRDLQAIATALATLVPLGLKVEASVVRDMLGFPDPEDGAELLGAPAAAGAGAAGAAPNGAETGGAAPRPSPARAVPEGEESPLPTPDQSQGPPSPASRERARPPLRRARDAADLLAGQAEDVAAPAADALIDQVRAIVEEAGSLEELRERLEELELDPADLAAALAQALAMAELLGRSEIAGGAG